ncbi:MAG: hypothetical protein ACE5IR_24365 [bacterium]
MSVPKRFTVLLILVCIFYPVFLFSQAFSFNINGYAKNLAIRSNSVVSNESFFLNITRFRTKGLLDFDKRIHSEVWLDNELLAGNFLSSADFKFGQMLQRPSFADLDWTITEGKNYQARQSLFRAFATVYLGPGEVTVGRQRIAWGTGFAWNPTDLLNPFNPAAIELEEREGVDAVYAVMPFGSLSRVEAAFAPGRNELKSSAAVRVSSNFWGYDVAFIAGDFQEDKVIGGDFAGYLSGAGFRGEFAYTWKEEGKNSLRAVLNVDYNFSHDIYALVEFYYNGQGATDPAKYDLQDLVSGRTFNLGRHYFAMSLAKSLTPLLRVSVYSIANLNDRSSLIGPVLTYSLANNLELAASAYFFRGSEQSEYGLLKSAYFGFLQFYF